MNLLYLTQPVAGPAIAFEVIALWLFLTVRGTIRFERCPSKYTGLKVLTYLLASTTSIYFAISTLIPVMPYGESLQQQIEAGVLIPLILLALCVLALTTLMFANEEKTAKGWTKSI